MNKTVRAWVIAVLVGGAVFGLCEYLDYLNGETGVDVLSVVAGVGLMIGTAFFLTRVLPNLGGNVKTVTLSDADKAAQLAAAPGVGQAALVVYRRGFVGRALGLDLEVDGVRLAQIKSPACTRLVVAAGVRRLEGKVPAAKLPSGMLELTLRDGETAYVRAVITLGKGSIALVAAPASEGVMEVAGVPMVAPF